MKNTKFLKIKIWKNRTNFSRPVKWKSWWKNPFPEYYNKSNSDKVIKESKEYYKRVFLNPTNILFVKTKLTQLLASLKSKISNVENEITVWNKRAEEYKKDLLSFSIEKSEEKDRAFDLYDCEMSGITNLKNYKKDLVRYTITS